MYIARLKALRAWVQYFLLTSSETSPDKREAASVSLSRGLSTKSTFHGKPTSGRGFTSRGLVEVQVTRLFRSKTGGEDNKKKNCRESRCCC